MLKTFSHHFLWHFLPCLRDSLGLFLVKLWGRFRDLLWSVFSICNVYEWMSGWLSLQGPCTLLFKSFASALPASHRACFHFIQHLMSIYLIARHWSYNCLQNMQDSAFMELASSAHWPISPFPASYSLLRSVASWDHNYSETHPRTDSLVDEVMRQ